ncbi:MAG: hypothetical protein HY362_01025 [Candidatus Aenigmarchaeota archaeon]|nr:hypothetical protein [Candidatus Aenigmarchaeota archaeon]
MNLWNRVAATDLMVAATKSLPMGERDMLWGAYRRDRANDYRTLRKRIERDPDSAGSAYHHELVRTYRSFPSGVQGLATAIRLRSEGLVPEPTREGVAQALVEFWRGRGERLANGTGDVSMDRTLLAELKETHPELFALVSDGNTYVSEALKYVRRTVEVVPV